MATRGLYIIKDLGIDIYSHYDNYPINSLLKIYKWSEGMWFDCEKIVFFRNIVNDEDARIVNENIDYNYKYVIDFEKRKIKCYKKNLITSKDELIDLYREAKEQLNFLRLHYCDKELKEYIEMFNSLDKNMFY